MKNILIITISTAVLVALSTTFINNRTERKISQIVEDKEKIVDSLMKHPRIDTLWLALPGDSLKVEIEKQLTKIKSQRYRNRELKEYIIFLENENQFLGSVLAEKELEDGIE